MTNNNETYLLKVFVLVLVVLLSFLTRLFSVLRYESVIHEFDPWFNYRTTIKIVRDGFYSFIDWFDEYSWYPLGRVVGGTVYPGLMLTSALIHNVLHFINIPIKIRNICVLFAPVFSGLTALSAYLLTKELKDETAGLFAALFLGIAPGYISRSVAGSYDNEGISIFLLVFTFYLWIISVKKGSSVYSVLTALFYFYMVASWGGYVYIINVIPLHVLVLIVTGGYNTKVYTAYSTFYVIGTLASMQIPFVNFQPVSTNDHMAALGVFGLLQVVGFSQFMKSKITNKNTFNIDSKKYNLFVVLSIVTLFFSALAALISLTTLGYIAPWMGRFYSLWDTSYAKKYIPIIASVSEHQPTAWGSMFFDLHYLLILFPAGTFFMFKEYKQQNIFVIIYAITSMYFAGVMVRLVLTLTPIVCIVGGVSMSCLLDTYMINTTPSQIELKPETNSEKLKNVSDQEKLKRKRNAESYLYNVKNIVPKILVTLIAFGIGLTFVYHSTWVTSNSYSSPSIVLSGQTQSGDMFIIDDFREAYYFLRKNTKQNSKILAWWDYGYQIAGMSNRTTIVDNNTWNNTHIATVGLVMAQNEVEAYKTLKKLDAEYVLIIFGGVIGYSGDDINKFLWMVRIAQNVYPNLVKEENYYNKNGEFRVDDNASKTLKESVMYKLSYYNLKNLYQGRQPVDRVRQSHIINKDINLIAFDEVFTSENWIVRIYKVKDQDVLNRSLKQSYQSKNNLKALTQKKIRRNKY